VARITVEDCLKRVENRFELVNATAQRVRQIREGSEYLVVSPKNEDIVVALREIAAGRVLVQHEIAEPEEVEAAEVEAAEAEAAEVEPEEAEAAEVEPEEAEAKEEENDTSD
jgi:DNA-directed RNA polymerase subunit omega